MNELYLYDVIGEDILGEGLSARTIRDELADVERGGELLLRINSPGGDVFEAEAIVSLLSDYRVSARIDGVAASAASYIAAHAENVEISDGGFYMVHNPWTITVGDASEHARTEQLLEKLTASLAKAYATKSGQSVEDIREWMDAETWFTADEAFQYGFASTITETRAAACAVPVEFGYKNQPLTPVARAEKPRATTSRLRAADRLRLARARLELHTG